MPAPGSGVVAGADLWPSKGHSSKWGSLRRLKRVQSRAEALNNLKGWPRSARTVVTLLETPLGFAEHVALFQIL